MTYRLQADCLPVLIGSLPLRDHQEATDLVLGYTPEIPLWVQLPAYRDEGMMAQFLPGMPGYRRDGDNDYIDAGDGDFEQELLAFYEEYMAVVEGGQALGETRFKLDQDRAEGFYALLRTLPGQGPSLSGVKGQITGPITFATGVKDQSKKAVFFDEQLRDAAIKLLALKAGWQVEQLAQFDAPVILFFDEPALAGFGSSELISISKQDVLSSFTEITEQVHGRGGLAGIHVCANADWSLVLDSDADILSFDAYFYFEKLLLYSDELRRFLDAGKILAWGMVPTMEAEDIDGESVDSLVSKFWDKFEALRKQTGLEGRQLLQQSLITPSCGTGSLSRERAERVLHLTRGLADRIRENL
jgi:methionine synthase II (cobalamin-independent)